MLRRLTRKRREDAHVRMAYRTVFSTEAGRVVLEDLCTRFKRVQNPEKGHDMADARAFHDGECSVVLHILKKAEDDNG